MTWIDTVPYNLEAACDNNLAVTFTSGNNHYSTVTSEGVVSVGSRGTATMRANQGGDEYFHPAPQVSRTAYVNGWHTTVVRRCRLNTSG